MMMFSIMHLLGLSLGFGVAMALDFILLKNIVRNETFRANHYRMIYQFAIFVTFGLAVLWISGIGFLWHYFQNAPEKLCNPKIWAKLSFVVILTCNGILIHHYLIPKLKTCIGRKLMDHLEDKQLRLISTSGAVSMVGWTIPFICGTVSELNYVYPFTGLMFAFLMVLFFAIIAANAFLRLVYKNHYRQLTTEMKINPISQS